MSRFPNKGMLLCASVSLQITLPTFALFGNNHPSSTALGAGLNFIWHKIEIHYFISVHISDIKSLL